MQDTTWNTSFIFHLLDQLYSKNTIKPYNTQQSGIYTHKSIMLTKYTAELYNCVKVRHICKAYINAHMLTCCILFIHLSQISITTMNREAHHHNLLTACWDSSSVSSVLVYIIDTAITHKDLKIIHIHVFCVCLFCLVTIFLSWWSCCRLHILSEYIYIYN